MQVRGLSGTRSLVVIGFWVVALLLLPSCSVNVKDREEAGAKKVDIETPMGSLHVQEQADVRDVGLPVYPGARPKPKEHSGDEKSANVNISGPGFGLKVVALEYESDDSPEKLISYYRDQLKKFGPVVACEAHGADITTDHSKAEHKPVSCARAASEKDTDVELKAGTEDDQHIVHVEPRNKGTNFALVYVKIHGKNSTI